MHILVLTATFPRWPGDVEPAFVFDLCRELVAGGHRVTVLAPHASGAALHERMQDVEVRRFRYAPERWERLAYDGGIMANLKQAPLLYALLPIYLLAQFVALIRSLLATQYDAVHAHWMIPQGVLMAAAQPFFHARPKLISIAHGSDVNALRGAFWALLRRWVAGKSDRVIAVSDALRDRLADEGCASRKLSVIPMGTDLQNTFVPDGSPRARVELLFVGRLVVGKGLDTLLHALPAIRRHHPDLVLTVVGAGAERNRFEALAHQLEVGACVSFVGAIPHDVLPACYRRATLLVVPSHEEGFGLVVVEALGCGCPVVASDLPVLRNVLLDGQAGSLFRPGDPHDLKETVCRLLADEPYRRTLAETGRRSVCERFDWLAIAEQYGHLPEMSGIFPQARTHQPHVLATLWRAFNKLFIAPRRYATGDDYDAARYWDERFRRHGPSMSSVGHEGKSEHDNAAAYAAQANAIFSMLDRASVDFPGARVMEIGCGNGYYAEQLSARGVTHYRGLDITEAFFALLRGRFPGFDYIRADITSSRLPELFDIVLMIDVIEHIVTEEKLVSALANVSAMMADNALLVLAPVAPRGRRSLFYVRFWTEADVSRALTNCRVIERSGRLLLIQKTAT